MRCDIEKRFYPFEVRTELADHEAYIKHGEQGAYAYYVPMPASDEDETEDGSNDDQTGIAEHLDLTEVGMCYFGDGERESFTCQHQYIAFHFQRNSVSQQPAAYTQLDAAHEITGNAVVEHEQSRHPHGDIRIESEQETDGYLQQLDNLIVSALQ